MKRNYMKTIIIFLFYLLLIQKFSTAAEGIKAGINLCLNTIIPSLFPFIVLTKLITNVLSEIKTPIFHLMGKMCSIPQGAEAILLPAFLGGYPVGAAAVCEYYKKKIISKESALRLLGFCSNAGPAFILGLGATIFEKKSAPWILWMIHIFSAVLVSFIIPRTDEISNKPQKNSHSSLSEIMNDSLKSMVCICGWIILFQSASELLFSGKYENNLIHIILYGIFELSGGCILLKKLPCEMIRFILFSCFLSMGGLCVAFQTKSLCGHLGTGLYLPGKLLQTSFSLIFSIIFGHIIYQVPFSSEYLVWLASAGIFAFGLSLFFRKKDSILRIIRV